jgi:hypothetical protein
MTPTKLELALGALVVECRWLPDDSLLAKRISRMAREIPLNWLSNDPYVKAPGGCQHGETTTKWVTPDDADPDVWVGRTTCDYCHLELHWNDRFGRRD